MVIVMAMAVPLTMHGNHNEEGYAGNVHDNGNDEDHGMAIAMIVAMIKTIEMAIAMAITVTIAKATKMAITMTMQMVTTKTMKMQ